MERLLRFYLKGFDRLNIGVGDLNLSHCLLACTCGATVLFWLLFPYRLPLPNHRAGKEAGQMIP